MAALRLVHPPVSFTNWMVSDRFMVSLGSEIESSVLCRKGDHREALVSASLSNWIFLGAI